MSCLIDRECVQRLNRVFKAVDCEVVLSSAWRYMILGGAMSLSGFSYMLRTHGLWIDQRLIGHTDDDGSDVDNPIARGVLIQRWLDVNHRPPRWAVVDDLCGVDMERVRKRLVATDGRVGIRDTDVDSLIALLGDAK
jgi:hypothetical protein